MKKTIKYIIFTTLFFSNYIYAKESLQKVSIQLQWLDQFQFAGYYMAKEKGFYTDANLDVEIKKFKHGIKPIDEVLNKKATYGIGRSSLIIDKSKGKEIVLLASIFQSSPLVFISLKDTNINTIADFKNKTAMVTFDDSSTVSLQAMMNKNNIQNSDLNILPYTYNINDLIDKKTDLMTAYSSNQPFELQKRGVKYNIFDPKDYGFDFYEDILFTHNDETIHHRERTKKFKKASLKGWEYAFNNIDETIKIMLKKYNTQNKTYEALKYEANELKKLAYLNTPKLGNIDKIKIQRIYDIYNLMGFVKNKIDMDAFVACNGKKVLLKLTKEEHQYLKNKKELTVCVKPNWLPYESIEDGEFVGISADFLNLVSQKLSIPLKVIHTKNQLQSVQVLLKKGCDLKPLMGTQQITGIPYKHTNAYFEDTIALVTRIEQPFVTNLDEIDKSVVIAKGFNRIRIFIKKKYPKLKILKVDTIEKGLDLVAKGKAFGYVGTSFNASYHIQKDYSTKLKIVNDFKKFQFGVGVKDDDIHLLNILNKVILTTTKKEKKDILNKWVLTTIEKEHDHTFVWQLSISFIIALLIILYFLAKQKSLNNQLKDTQQNFDLGQNIANVGIWTLNYDTNKLNWTEGVHNIFQTDSSKFVTSFEAFLKFVHPSDRDILTKEYSDSVKEKRDYFIEHRIIVNDVVKFVEERCHNYFNKNGEITKSVGTILDITKRKSLEDSLIQSNINLERKVEEKVKELKESKKYYEDMVENLNDWVWEVDENGIYTFCNQKVYDVIGYTVQEVIGKTPFDFMSKQEAIRVGNIFKTIADNKDTIINLENELIHKDGHKIICNTNGKPLFSNTGKRVGYRGIDRDITLEQKMKNEKALQDQQMLQQSKLAQMGEMISMIAHQWRQPLTAISATTNNLSFKIMMDDIDKEEFEKEINLISDYSQHLSKTINDFRGFFKENKNKELTTTGDIVNSTLKIIKTLIENRNIKLDINVDCDDEFYSYPNEIKQVVLNLIKNAEDILIDREIENPVITLETKCIEDKKIIIVKDNAKGIPLDIIEKIFDPYFSTKKEKDGTGLGLYMSKTIIEEHCGGKLTVLNDKDGAIFTISLIDIKEGK